MYVYSVNYATVGVQCSQEVLKCINEAMNMLLAVSLSGADYDCPYMVFVSLCVKL